MNGYDLDYDYNRFVKTNLVTVSCKKISVLAGVSITLIVGLMVGIVVGVVIIYVLLKRGKLNWKRKRYAHLSAEFTEELFDK